MGAIIQLTREYLSKEAGRMGGCGHRIGYLHIFTTSPLKLCRGVIFGSVTVSSDVKNETARNVKERKGGICWRRGQGDDSPDTGRGFTWTLKSYWTVAEIAFSVLRE